MNWSTACIILCVAVLILEKTYQAQGLQFNLASGTDHSGIVQVQLRPGEAFEAVCAGKTPLYSEKWPLAICAALGKPIGHAVRVSADYFRDPVRVSRAVKLEVNCTSPTNCTLVVPSAGGYCLPPFTELSSLLAVLCTDEAPRYQLTNVDERSIGRLEVSLDGVWGAVCQNTVFPNFTEVACRSLQMPSEDARSYTGLFHAGNIGTSLTFAKCNGSDADLSECQFQSWGYPCVHDAYLGLSCQPVYDGKVRLSDISSGKVEIYHRGRWAGVSVRDWSSADAVVNVICGVLNLTTSPVSHFKMSRKTEVWLEDVQCTGSEENLSDCQGADLSGITDTTQDYQLRAICGPPDYSLRLRDGPNNNTGRLEVWLNGEWGTICDKGFTDTSAQAACFKMGLPIFQAGKAANGTYKHGTGRIWLEDVNCYDPYSDFRFCVYSVMVGQTDCNHSRDVGIICTGSPPPREEPGLTIWQIIGIVGGFVGFVVTVNVIWQLVPKCKRRKRGI